MTFKNYTAQDLAAILIRAVQRNKPHAHYQNNVNYAKWCKQIMTGDDQDELIVSYKIRETSEQKKQRIHITNSRTQYTAGRIEKVYEEIERVDNVVDNKVYINSDQDQRNTANITELNRALSSFHRNKDLKSYLYARLKYFNFYDPNAFLIVEFDNFDPKNRKPIVYPYEVTSDRVYDYEYQNGVLQYLIVKNVLPVIVNKRPTNADEYILYGINHAYRLREITDGYEAKGDNIEVPIGNSKKQFDLQYFNTKSEQCPAIPVGYIPDPRTNCETFVSPLHPAEKLYIDLINTKSEYDLSRALHGFIQKFAFADQCNHAVITDGFSDMCRNGYMNDGSKCPRCDGTGLQFHTSVQDIVLKRMPEGKDEHIPLSGMVHFVEIPEHIIERQKNDLRDIERDITTAIFLSEVFDRSEIATTATEKRLEQQGKQNALNVYAAHWDSVYRQCVYLTAMHLQINRGLVVDFSHPTDFKLLSIDDLLIQRKMAMDASAPYPVVAAIDRDIMAKQNRNNPELVQMMEAREQFKPFKTKTANERISILADLSPDDYFRLLYVFFDEIFTEIEMESTVPFFQMDYEIQKQLVDEKVQQYQLRYSAPPLRPFSAIEEEE